MRLTEGFNITQDLIAATFADPSFLFGFEAEFYVETHAGSDEDVEQVRMLVYKMVADRLQRALGEPVVSAYDADTAVTASEGYTKWVVTRDNDLYSGEVEGSQWAEEEFMDWRLGVEVISPAKQLSDGFESMVDFFEFINEGGLPNVKTSHKTGFHINMGIRNIESELDYIKMLFLLDDEYVIKKFGRQHLTATTSLYKHLNQTVGSRDARSTISKLENMLRADKQDINEFEYLLGNLLNRGKMSVNLNKLEKGYIEFRHAGGEDYFHQIDDIIDTVIKFAVTMHVARSPDLMRKEYLSALYKFVVRVGRELDDPQLADSVGMIGQGTRGGYSRGVNDDNDGVANGPYDGENYIGKYGFDPGSETS